MAWKLSVMYLGGRLPHEVPGFGRETVEHLIRHHEEEVEAEERRWGKR